MDAWMGEWVVSVAVAFGVPAPVPVPVPVTPQPQRNTNRSRRKNVAIPHRCCEILLAYTPCRPVEGDGAMVHVGK